MAVVLSVIGVQTYDAAGPAEVEYAVTWPTKALTLDRQQDAQLSDGATFTFPIEVDNLTQVRFDVAASGNGPRPQDVRVNINVAPPGLTVTQRQITLTASPQGGSEQETVTVAVQTVPDVNTIMAGSDKQALAELASHHTKPLARGTWTVTVTLSNPDVPLPSTEQISVTVSGEATSYEASVQLKAPDINR